MAVEAATIEKMILEGIPDATVRIEDLRGDGDHYAAYVSSPSFKGKTRVQQHQMVYNALQDKMDGDLHALSRSIDLPSAAIRKSCTLPSASMVAAAVASTDAARLLITDLESNSASSVPVEACQAINRPLGSQL